MTQLPKVGTYEFLCEPFLCDFSQRMFMGQLGNKLINAADFHSNDRDFGINYLGPRNLTWVLSRLAIDMDEMPAAYTRFTIETWVESAMRYFTNRNFCIKDGNRILGYGKSVWAMIDTEKRQPQDILKVHDGAIVDYLCPEKECGITQLSRVKMSAKAECCGQFRPAYSDTDYNGHVNSIKYIEHILDLWQVDFYRTNHIKRLDIAYVAESYVGDTLNLYRDTDIDGGVMVSVRKINDTLEKEIECVRCKVTFV